MGSESPANDARPWRSEYAWRIAAAGGIRSYRAHDQYSRVLLKRGAATVTSSISLSQNFGTRHDRSGKGARVYLDLSRHHLVVVVVRCGTRTAQRDAPISSPIGCRVARHMHIPLHKRASRRDGEGAMGRFARPRAPREQHRRDTANHRCAWVQVREEEYLL